jgi:hypothetical protein
MIVPDKAWPWIGLLLFVALAAVVPTVFLHLLVLYGG